MNISRIILIETHYRNRRIYLEKDGALEFLDTTLQWNQLLAQLPAMQFSFVQKSFLVAFKYLLSRTSNTVTLKHKGKLNISKRCAKEFDHAYAYFLRQDEVTL